MKRLDLIRHLETHGCEFLREGGNHTIYVNRKTRKSSPMIVMPLCQVEIPARLVSEQRAGGWLPSLQRPPHPGPLPPLGRAEREQVSTSANSTRTELRYRPATVQPTSRSPRQLGVWRSPAVAGVPLSPGERARVRAGVNSIFVQVRSSSSSVRQPKRQLRSASQPHSKTLARSFRALSIRGHSLDSRPPSSAFRVPPSHFAHAPR